MKRPAEDSEAANRKASPRGPGTSPRAPAFKAIPLPGLLGPLGALGIRAAFPSGSLGGLLLPDVSSFRDKVSAPPWKVSRTEGPPSPDPDQAVAESKAESKAEPKKVEAPKSVPVPVGLRPMQAPPWRMPDSLKGAPERPPRAVAPERPPPKAGLVVPAAGPPGASPSTSSSSGSGGASFSKAAAAAGMVPSPSDLLRRGEELLRQTAQLHQQNEIAQKQQEENRRKLEEIEKRRAEVEEKRRLEGEKKRLVEEEQQNLRRQADEAAQALQDELRKLIEVAELEVQMAEAESGKIESPSSCEEIVRVTEDFEAVALTAQHAVKEFMDGRHMKLKGNTEATMSNCASLLKRSHAAKGTVDMILAKVRQKAKPAKDELLARSLQAELESLLAIAEAEVSNVRTLQEAMEKAARQANVDKGDAADKALLSACTALEQPGQSALQATLRCTNLLDQNVKQIHGTTEELKARSTKLASQARQLRNALDQLLEKAQLVKMAAIQRIEKEAKRVAAEKEAKRQEDIFDQYDQDQDGLLSSKEILAYVKGEHHFDLEEEKLQHIMELNPAGVSKQHFARLRSQVSLIWSDILAKQRKDRSEKQMLQLRKGAAEIQSALAGVEAEVAKAENQVRHLPQLIKRANVMMHQLSERTDAAESAVDAAKDFLAAAKEQAQGLDSEMENEAKTMARLEVGKVRMKISLLETRLNQAAVVTKSARSKLQLEEKKAEIMRQAAGF